MLKMLIGQRPFIDAWRMLGGRPEDVSHRPVDAAHNCTPTALRPTSADLGRLHGALERGEAAHAYFLAVLGR